MKQPEPETENLYTLVNHRGTVITQTTHLGDIEWMTNDPELHGCCVYVSRLEFFTIIKDDRQ